MNILDKIRDLDRKRCRFCGSYHNLEVHHIVYRSRGGKNTKGNLVTLCQVCHVNVHRHKITQQMLFDRLRKSKDYRWEESEIYWRNCGKIDTEIN